MKIKDEMNILVNIFTAEANTSKKACREAQKDFNDFMASTCIDRIISITTNTINVAMDTDRGDCWFTYTLTLVYEAPEAQ